MFVFDDTAERTFSRKKALGFKEFEIAEDVVCGAEAEIGLEDGKIIVKPSDKTVPEGEEPEMTLLIPEFGVFGGVKSKIEVTLCDNVMLITLIEGAIDIRMNDEVMMASRGVDESKLSTQGLDSVIWVNVETLLRFTRYWCGCNSDYPFDYTYQLEVSGSNSGNYILNFKPMETEFLFDISNGRLDEVAQKRKLQEQIAQVKNMGRVLTNNTGITTETSEMDDLDYNPADYEDFDEDDDDEFNAYDVV